MIVSLIYPLHLVIFLFPSFLISILIIIKFLSKVKSKFLFDNIKNFLYNHAHTRAYFKKEDFTFLKIFIIIKKKGEIL